MWFRKKVLKRKRRKSLPNKHYLTHKERVRVLVHQELERINTQYGFVYHKVAIRDQKSRWGSCSIKGNLNFNYRIVFLPQHLVSYIIAHELCHLKEFNHGPHFWALVGKVIPEYQVCRAELRSVRMEALTT